MPGADVKLGPFTAGLNNVSEIGTIPDNALSDILNFELDIDGSLVSRPAIIADKASGATFANLTMLGYAVDANNVTFLVCANATAGNTQMYNVATQAWTVIWSGLASGFAQYNNTLVLTSASAAGGYWDMGALAFTSTPTMPIAAGIVLYQQRFWAWGVQGTANATTLWYSNLNVISPPQSIYDWVTTSNFITVSKGDGQWITALVADVNALLIFRSGSTWQFTYPGAVANGTLRVLSPTIGAENQFCIVNYENYYLVFSAGFLYQFINYKWYPLNTKKVAFSRASLANGLQFNIRVSLFSRRAIVWYYGATYVYSIITQTWTRWDSPTTHAGHFMMVPASSTTGDFRTALAVTGENDATKKQLWRITDSVLQTLVGETMTCTIRTKAYALNQYGKYKRLFSWSAEIRSSSGVQGSAFPVALSVASVTWDQMALTTWDVLALGSWDNPLVPAPVYQTNVAFPTATPADTVVRLLQGFRFLRSYYQLSLTADGTTKTSPARIYAITLVLAVEAGVSKQVS